MNSSYSDYCSVTEENVVVSPFTSIPLAETGRKCKAAAEASRAKRPRAKFVEREDIPVHMRRFRKIDIKSTRRAPMRSKSRSHFTKQLIDSRPKLPPSPNSEDHNNSLSESESELSNSDSDAINDNDASKYRRRVEEHISDSPVSELVEFEDGFKLRCETHELLFDHQIEGIKWLWALHRQETGGIIGDDMGLGKTAQVISFLGGLQSLGLYKPSLVLCPATLLSHWVEEIWNWHPSMRACVLHDSHLKSTSTNSYSSIVDEVWKTVNGLLITTYEHFRIHINTLEKIQWGYVILDEGHKIKNPNAEITLLVKKVRTRHRLIITGSPVQNKLTDLWSLFDFIFPGKLGTLPVFETEFEVPIQVGGYKNASRLSVALASKCAAILRDIITPYVLIRKKSEVDLNLPAKKEQVLFCTLSKEQKALYREYINSAEVENIIRGKQQVLAGIDTLKKICNHPDLLHHSIDEISDYGEATRSGKLQLCLKIIKQWKGAGDKVLIFTQTQQMLDILEFHIQQLNYNYRRMDGQSSIASRGKNIRSFNSDANVFAFLLTTRVGGLGVNLTGANKVLIYDPDWNPSIDTQARERAWRIGQNREVTIYRLVTSGTIEAKIYQRQIFKQFLKERVLSKTSQQQLFSSRRIRELFTYYDEKEEKQKETERLFPGMHFEKTEDPILKSLLGDCVHNVLDQKAVEASLLTGKLDLASYEATQTAKEALTRMQTAEEKRSEYDINIPTWTGKNGMAGAPPTLAHANDYGWKVSPKTIIKAPLDALSAPPSNFLLSKLKERKIETMQNESKPETESCILPAKPLPERKEHSLRPSNESVTKRRESDLKESSLEECLEYKSQIVHFFKQRGRVVDASVLCSHLLSQIDVNKRAQFKNMVQCVAKQIKGTKRWVLNSKI